jgi:hypothetical protein
VGKRKPTVCQSCGYPSWNGRVCRCCLAYWGGPVENVLAAVRLRRRLDGATAEQIAAILSELCDIQCPDMPGPYLPALLYQKPASAAPIPAADTNERNPS